ncbi:hypothetical protein HMPREF9233_01406 [Actinobaculum massiliense ACS-171-V-Col2]|uniref:Uncharacterized protein n=1 Tax=Actinobaculum massiliense ACS-171-V-Col2 TaxID=883066 RepID=K9EVG1_9ACTO|nr:hypothetical protein HMPREF9233_01406 [Actinobaculum massiliense ACS-171-V-Col2]
MLLFLAPIGLQRSLSSGLCVLDPLLFNYPSSSKPIIPYAVMKNQPKPRSQSEATDSIFYNGRREKSIPGAKSCPGLRLDQPFTTPNCTHGPLSFPIRLTASQSFALIPLLLAACNGDLQLR